MSGGLGSGEFAEIALALHEAPHADQLLELVVEQAWQAVTCRGAGLLLLDGTGRLESAVVSDPQVAKVEQLQVELGEGPALLTMQHHAAVVVGDVGADDRWPQWGALAAEQGLRSMVAVQLSTGEVPFGALSLYSAEPAAFDEDDVAVAEIFALHASIAVATAQEEAGLRRAMDARHLVGQAQGMLMERYGLDPDRAFAVLRRLSQNNRIKLREAAEQVVLMGRPGAEP